MDLRIGVDLGGTKIEAAALDETGRIVLRERRATPRDDYRGTLRTIGDLVTHLETTLGATARVGIGIPGTISPATGLVKNANSVWLIGRPLDQDLSRLLGRPLRFANDANCFALSEATDGAAAGADSVFGVIVGTGTGGGLVINGHVVVGANAIGGEWGHNPLPWPRAGEWPGPPCYCGRTGCIETFLSGPALVRAHEAASGERVETAEIVGRAATGDAVAEASLRQYEERMARALASIINVFDPEMIVLGGGMSNLTRLYTRVPRLWGDFVFSDRVVTRLVRATHGDSSGVRGAAWLWAPPGAEVERA